MRRRRPSRVGWPARVSDVANHFSQPATLEAKGSRWLQLRALHVFAACGAWPPRCAYTCFCSQGPRSWASLGQPASPSPACVKFEGHLQCTRISTLFPCHHMSMVRCAIHARMAGRLAGRLHGVLRMTVSIIAQGARRQPAIAQLAEHLTVEICSNQMVPGSIPGGRRPLGSSRAKRG